MGLSISPNADYITGAATDPPTLKLMGKEWPIPKFTPRQNEIIIPIILDLTPLIVKSMNEPLLDVHGKPILDDKGKPKKVPALEAMRDVLTREHIKQLYTCLYMALTRAHKITREEFDENCEVGVMELLDCVFTISDQTGMIKFRPSTSTEDAAALMFGKKVGEEKAANLQTGVR